jgi:tetratricopeptide (TPR) repeat protein
MFFMNLRILIFFLSLFLFFSCKTDTKKSSGDSDVLDPNLEQLNRAISEKPTDASLYFKRGKYYYENDNYDKAIEDLEVSKKLDSLNPDVYHLLSDVFLDYPRSAMALSTMENAAQKFPTRIPTLLKLCEIETILQQFSKSKETVDKILKIDPTNSEAFFMLGRNFLEEKDTARAINSYQMAIDNDPKMIDGYIALGNIFMVKKKPIASRYFDGALQIDSSDINALHAKAYYLQSTKKDKDALALYRRIINLDPQYVDSYFNSAAIYLSMDSFKTAEKNFDLAVKMDPIYFEAIYFRGVSKEAQGRLKEALSDYIQANKLQPSYESASKARKALEAQGVTPTGK